MSDLKSRVLTLCRDRFLKYLYRNKNRHKRSISLCLPALNVHHNSPDVDDIVSNSDKKMDLGELENTVDEEQNESEIESPAISIDIPEEEDNHPHFQHYPHLLTSFKNRHKKDSNKLRISNIVGPDLPAIPNIPPEPVEYQHILDSLEQGEKGFHFKNL